MSASNDGPVCTSCKRPIEWEPAGDPLGKSTIIAIRCIDCGFVFCGGCARRHFRGNCKDRRIEELEALVAAESGAAPTPTAGKGE